MGEIVNFEVGCRRCEHLIRIDKNSWMCEERVHQDDTEVVPIRDGAHTEDWNVCSGEDYRIKIIQKKSKTKSS